MGPGVPEGQMSVSFEPGALATRALCAVRASRRIAEVWRTRGGPACSPGCQQAPGKAYPGDHISEAHAEG